MASKETTVLWLGLGLVLANALVTKEVQQLWATVKGAPKIGSGGSVASGAGVGGGALGAIIGGLQGAGGTPSSGAPGDPGSPNAPLGGIGQVVQGGVVGSGAVPPQYDYTVIPYTDPGGRYHPIGSNQRDLPDLLAPPPAPSRSAPDPSANAAGTMDVPPSTGLHTPAAGGTGTPGH